MEPPLSDPMELPFINPHLNPGRPWVKRVIKLHLNLARLSVRPARLAEQPRPALSTRSQSQPSLRPLLLPCSSESARSHAYHVSSPASARWWQLDEWLAPLPPAGELLMHDPGSVQVLFSRLLTFPSLLRYAALPTLFLSSDFIARGGSSSVTRIFVRFGGPRFGVSNLKGPSAISGARKMAEHS